MKHDHFHDYHTLNPNPHAKPRERLLTRREAVAFIREEFGVPVGVSAFSCGERKLTPCGQRSPRAAPAPAARYGRRYLYRPRDIRAWGQRLIEQREIEGANT